MLDDDDGGGGLVEAVSSDRLADAILYPDFASLSTTVTSIGSPLMSSRLFAKRTTYAAAGPAVSRTDTTSAWGHAGVDARPFRGTSVQPVVVAFVSSSPGISPRVCDRSVPVPR